MKISNLKSLEDYVLEGFEMYGGAATKGLRLCKLELLDRD